MVVNETYAIRTEHNCMIGLKIACALTEGKELPLPVLSLKAEKYK